MKKTTIFLLLIVVNSFYVIGQVTRQGFDNQQKDNWLYTSNIPFYEFSNGADLWKQKSGSNGRISGPFSGTSYLAGRDLDNEYSESVTGMASPEHILNFEPIYIGGLGAEMSFRVHYVGIDKNDYIYYQLSYNNGTDWSTYDYMADVFRTNQNGNFNSRGWEEVKYTVPTGPSFVRMRLVIYQNGNEYLGFDDFQVVSQTLSTKDNLIEGFTYGPNPTNGVLRMKAKTTLDKASVYDVLGKEVFSQKGSSTEMTLNIANITSGLYLVKVQSGEVTQTFKIINK
ncbi:putative secreted protein (Por secretion system target) [Flavobacteriaceae bacterium MAR_2010_72]|nr:putative secreted protein (Por secretion system target) [Flavobacteriaceae bacterium MAR_2010_72]TVZ58291.1 putative secreted protein (Por secretion system target) [Flavobacteriaceae bacterium MAR_2010_105]